MFKLNESINEVNTALDGTPAASEILEPIATAYEKMRDSVTKSYANVTVSNLPLIYP